MVTASGENGGWTCYIINALAQKKWGDQEQDEEIL